MKRQFEKSGDKRKETRESCLDRHEECTVRVIPLDRDYEVTSVNSGLLIRRQEVPVLSAVYV